MATDIAGLFGITPQAYNQQQQQLIDAEAQQFAKLDPYQQVTAGSYGAGRQLGRGIVGALGGEDPMLQKITAQSQILLGLNMEDPNALTTAAQRASQAGIPELSLKLLAVRDQAIQRQQALLNQQQTMLAQRIAMQGYQPAQPEVITPEKVVVDQAADTSYLEPQRVTPAVPASYDVSRVAPELLALGGAGRQILKEYQPEYKVVGDSLYQIPLAGAPKPVVDAIKGESFTGNFANAALTLFGTAKVAKIPQTPEAMKAIVDKAVDIAKEMRPQVSVTNTVSNNMQKGFGEDLTNTINTNLAGARTAGSALANIQSMQFLLEQGVRTGFGQQTMLQLGQAGQIFNPNLNIKGLAGQEAFQAYSNQVILPEVKKLGVNPTDTDLKFIVQGSPSLSKTPAGNSLLLDALSLKLQREQDLGRYSNQWLATNAALVKNDPIIAQTKFNTDFLNYQQTSPLYTQALQQLKIKFNALGGSGGGANTPAGNALQQGGFVR